MKNKVLLVDPTSIAHMPPRVLNNSERERSKKYGEAINEAVSKHLNANTDTINAFSGKYAVNYGLLMLGYLLKNNDIKVDFISGDFFEDESSFMQYLSLVAIEYSVAALTSTTPQFEQVKRINNILKENNPNIKTILGGPHTLYYKTGDVNENIDIIHIGHGIDISAQLIERLLKGEELKDKIIKTDYYYDCPKAFELIPEEHINNTMLYSYLSFGCPNNCNYCMEHKLVKKVCYNNIDEKIKEIELLVNKYNRKFIHLADSDFLINRVYLNEFLDKLEKSDLKCCFSVNATPTTLSDERNFELIRKFINNGLVEILIGVEHFSPKVLKLLNKRYDIEKLFSALKIIKEDLKLPVMSLYSLVGFPGEDKEAIKQNIDVFKRINKEKLYDFSFPKFFVPYPDTDIYLYPDKYNVKLLTEKWDEYHRWSLPRPIEIVGMKDEDYLKEIEEIARISGY